MGVFVTWAQTFAKICWIVHLSSVYFILCHFTSVLKKQIHSLNNNLSNAFYVSDVSLWAKDVAISRMHLLSQEWRCGKSTLWNFHMPSFPVIDTTSRPCQSHFARKRTHTCAHTHIHTHRGRGSSPAVLGLQCVAVHIRLVARNPPERWVQSLLDKKLPESVFPKEPNSCTKSRVLKQGALLLWPELPGKALALLLGPRLQSHRGRPREERRGSPWPAGSQLPHLPPQGERNPNKSPFSQATLPRKTKS